MSKKVFTRGKYYHYRIFVNGKDCWHSTGKTSRVGALVVAENADAAAKGKGDVEKFFDALMTRIAKLPPGTGWLSG